VYVQGYPVPGAWACTMQHALCRSADSVDLAIQVGKPGSSKSLALRLINANLRGVDSSDAFYRQLPTVRGCLHAH
jgi:hypothetical protein